MVELRKLLAAGAALAMSGAFAQAADMPAYPPPPALVALNSGWYVRGDLGAAWGLISDTVTVGPLTNPTDSSLGNGMTGGLGIGIKSSWLRTDVTLDYLSPLKYQGAILTSGDTTAKIQSSTALLNGYIDLGTWYRLTPYIGGGVGLAYTRVSDVASTGALLTGDTGKNQWSFAWAGMTGLAFAISHNLILDVGYRYLNIGDVSTASNPLGAVTFKNVAAHELRAGVRWSFDDIDYAH